MADGVLGLGIMVELYNNFSTPASAIQNSMAGITNQSNTMASVTQKAMTNMQNAMGGLMAGVALASPFGMAINSARNFEQQLSNIKSLGVTGDKMAMVEKLAMDMGAKTKFSALEAAQGIEELLKAGVSTEAVMHKDGLSGALDLAVAGGLKLADAAEIASTALNAFSKDQMTIRQAGDILSGAANASATDVSTLKFSLSAVSAVASGIGLSFKDTNTALASFAQNGLKGSDAGTSLKTMLMNLQPRSREQIATFKQLGFITAQGANAFFDASGNIKDMASIAGLLNTNLKNLNPQQRAFALETMFGSDAVRAGNILFKEGAEGINKMQAEMTRFTSANVAKERLNNFNGAVEMLMGSIDTIMIKVGQLFLPTMTRIVKVTGTVVDAFEALINTDLGKYLVLATAGVTSFVVVFGAIVPFIQTTISVMRTLAVVAGQTALAFAPYIAIAGVVMFAFKSFSSFKDVLEGTAKPAQGLLGFMQKLGGVIWTVGQVLSTWDGKAFDFGGNEAQLKALGILDTLVAVATYTVRVIEFVKGVGSAFVQTFSLASSIVNGFISVVSAGLSYIGKLFGMQDAKLKSATTALESWQLAGKVVGYTIVAVMLPVMGLLVGSAVSATVAFGSMAVSMAVAFAPFIGIGALLAGVIAVFYYWDDIVKVVSKNFNIATKAIAGWASGLWKSMYAGAVWFFDGVGSFVSKLPSYFYSAIEYIGTAFYTGFSQLIPYMIGSLVGMGVWVVSNIPSFFYKAFELSYSATRYFITQAIPYMYNKVGEFLGWLGTTVYNGFSDAFTYALQGAYWAVSQGVPMVVGVISDFLGWALEAVPNALWEAFSTASQWVYDQTGAMFSDLGDIFYKGGEAIMNLLWEGIKSVWESLKQWFNDSLNALTLGFSEGLGSAESTLQATQSRVSQGGGSSDFLASDMQTQFAQVKAEKERIAMQTVANNSTQNFNGAQNITLAIDLDGNEITKMVNLQNAMNESRR